MPGTAAVTDAITIHGFGPLPVRRPATAAEVGAVVRECRAAEQGVYPVGGGTLLDLGYAPTKLGVALSTLGLNRVIDYPARDMTITVEAGLTLAVLQETLAKENQWLPIDVPAADRATVGGAVAANVSGPRRLGYGTLRDYVIGVRFVSDDGVEVKGGGRVVKNVAGYDLMKLHTGALGTLGVVTEVTLKVRPRPEESALVAFGCDAGQVGPLLDLLHASRSRPVAVELLNAAAWRAGGVSPPSDSPWILAAGFEEKKETVDWQAATLLAELKTTTAQGATDLRGPAAGDVWRALTELQRRPESKAIWKASVLPSGVAQLAVTLSQSSPYLIHAEALNGIVWVHDSGDVIRDVRSSELSFMEQRIAAAPGTYSMRRCPREWQQTLHVFGRPAGDRELMQHVKRTLDPDDVFNPGRLFQTGPGERPA